MTIVDLVVAFTMHGFGGRTCLSRRRGAQAHGETTAKRLGNLGRCQITAAAGFRMITGDAGQQEVGGSWHRRQCLE